MNAGHILDALEQIDDQYILEARDRNPLAPVKKFLNLKHALGSCRGDNRLAVTLRICRVQIWLV